MPCHAHAVLCRVLEKSLSERQVRDTTRNAHGMPCVNQTRSQYVNQMRKIPSKPLPAWNGMRTGWARHGYCIACVNYPLYLWLGRLLLLHVNTSKALSEMSAEHADRIIIAVVVIRFGKWRHEESTATAKLTYFFVDTFSSEYYFCDLSIRTCTKLINSFPDVTRGVWVLFLS
jgi:hypothetical protein